MTPDLAIIIPHFNDADRLARCLAALEVQDRTGVDVVVADNDSAVDLTPLQARFPFVRLVHQSRPGAGLARNAGVASTDAPWFAFIDADCVADADWIARAKHIAAGDPDIVTGGRVDVFDETPPPRTGAEAFEAVFAFHMRRYLEEEGFLGAGNLIVSRRTFDRTGPFLGHVAEDVEWSRRAAREGAVLAYDDALGVGHPSRSDWPSLCRKWRRMTDEAWALRSLSGGLGQRLAWVGRACLMPASIVLHMPRVLSCRALRPRERGPALATLIRLRLLRMVWMLRQAWRGRA